MVFDREGLDDLDTFSSKSFSRKVHLTVGPKSAKQRDVIRFNFPENVKILEINSISPKK